MTSKAPTEFYTASVFSERSGEWELMTDRMMDLTDAVQIVRDYSDTYTRWLVILIDLNSGTAQDVTDAICAEAADDSDDCSSYAAQRREYRSAVGPV